MIVDINLSIYYKPGRFTAFAYKIDGRNVSYEKFYSFDYALREDKTWNLIEMTEKTTAKGNQVHIWKYRKIGA